MKLSDLQRILSGLKRDAKIIRRRGAAPVCCNHNCQQGRTCPLRKGKESKGAAIVRPSEEQ